MSKSSPSWFEALLSVILNNRLVTLLVFAMLLMWGVYVAPFDWSIPGIDRDPVPVDAIPDIGENQQIVFTEWAGRSPQDVDDQITYPLTVALLGTPEVKTVRSFSMFGFSTIYVIFKEEADFYWSRSRILEKLNALPEGTLPEAVSPRLGPDATGLGQVFWYTLEGRDEQGNVTGGWDLQEVRSIQDYYVKYALSTVPGVAEVASVGGYVKEYQIDVNPQTLRHYGISLIDVFKAIRMSNNEIGARTLEINRMEYLIRVLGFVKNLDDIEKTVIKVVNNVPVTVSDVAHVTLGPASRRGALDKRGSEVVGGVVTTRYGDNPLAAIKAVKSKIKEISPGLPSKELADGTLSKLTIVPFYDRSGLIQETLGTLNHALRDEMLITVLVILVLMAQLQASVLISLMMPMAVLMTFVTMKLFQVDANIVALSGIAIAIGTIVDMGIIMTENILKHLRMEDAFSSRLKQIKQGAVEVGPAILTAVSTTIISFLPVFAMEGAEGKLFKPLAYTKTFALFMSVVIALILLPVLATFIFRKFHFKPAISMVFRSSLFIVGGVVIGLGYWMIGTVLILVALAQHFRQRMNSVRPRFSERSQWMLLLLAVLAVLSGAWLPLGPMKSELANLVFVAVIAGGLLWLIQFYTRKYSLLLAWMLAHRKLALSLPLGILLLGITVWQGLPKLTGWLPEGVRSTRFLSTLSHAFPGIGKEFMPPLDEGSFLYMPTTMPHAGMEESLDVLSILDQAIYSIPEVEEVVGKIGRAETALDPAPLSMIESIITYKSEYMQDESGNILTFMIDEDGQFMYDDRGALIPSKNGRPYRQWREAIKGPNDIWDEIVKAADLPGTTSAPKLQPIAARIVMLQSGMRAPMGIQIQGAQIESLESFGLELEDLLKESPGVRPASVFADRIIGKPYLEIEIDREAIARYGLRIQDVQEVLAVAIGGRQVTSTFEGRERYPVRIRYMRGFREDVGGLRSILIPVPGGAQIPLDQVASIRFSRGPQVIKSENTFLVSYVLFDKLDGWSEVDVVEAAQALILSRIGDGSLKVPSGTSYSFTGSYQNQLRATQKLRVVLPLALTLIFVILYLQFKRVSTTLMVFSGVFVAWSGGFILLWLYGQDWFLNVSLAGLDLREIFQLREVNLSVAVWVGFLALFGIATDDGVLISTYLDQQFKLKQPTTRKAISTAAIEAGSRRIGPAMMTTATTILALLPILTSTGRGSDVMLPMAIPSFGGMFIVTLNTLVVPVLYVLVAEKRILKKGVKK